MEFERRNGYKNGNPYGNGDGNGDSSPTMASLKIFPVSSSSTSSAPSSSSSSPARYIEHHVTKLDTLAGIAIRYGVEVADIKKLNSLVSDLQMFALKTLLIPLPGRHPPSPCLSNGHASSGLGQHLRWLVDKWDLSCSSYVKRKVHQLAVPCHLMEYAIRYI